MRERSQARSDRKISTEISNIETRSCKHPHLGSGAANTEIIWGSPRTIVTSVWHAPAPPHSDPNCSSHCAAVMEATCAIPRSDTKQVDEIKRVQKALALG